MGTSSRGFRPSCRREVSSPGLQWHPCCKEAPCKEAQHRHAALLPPRPREARCVQSEGAVGHEGSLLECATQTTQDEVHLAHRLRGVTGPSACAGKTFRPHAGSTSSAAQGFKLDGARGGPMDQGQLCHCSRSFPQAHSYMKALRAVKAQKMPDSVLFHLISSVI